MTTLYILYISHDRILAKIPFITSQMTNQKILYVPHENLLITSQMTNQQILYVTHDNIPDDNPIDDIPDENPPDIIRTTLQHSR